MSDLLPASLPPWDVAHISFKLRLPPFEITAWHDEGGAWSWCVRRVDNPQQTYWFQQAEGRATTEEKAKEAALAALGTALFIEEQNKAT